ncbi:MAG: DNA polymerase, partial [Candidatus Saccharimonadales bacterium]
AFDARILNITDELKARGWKLTGMAITEGPVWFKFRNGSKRITLTDSYALLPAPLEKIAADIGMAKTVLPDNDDDTPGAWAARCSRDAEILMSAILRCMQWWDDNEMGRWALSGPGCGWNAYRHKYSDEKVLISVDETAMRFERRAVYGGRREAFRIGTYDDGYFADLDFVGAYPTIAGNNDLPSQRGTFFDSAPDDWHKNRSRATGVIAECIAWTDKPLVPARYGGVIFYPKGTFNTVLASPEIDLIERNGGKVFIGRGYRYQLGPIMRTWGTEIMRILNTSPDDIDPVVIRMVKHWSRSTLGRWTMQVTRTSTPRMPPFSDQPVTRNVDYEYAPEDTFTRDGISFVRTGASPIRETKSWIVTLGDDIIELIRDQESDNGFPAIWAWIESICRVSLWEAMQTAPPHTLLQCDTDGFMLGWGKRNARKIWRVGDKSDNAPPGPWSVDWTPPVAPKVGGLSLRLKNMYHDVTIIGPQQLKLDNTRRMAGVPRDARETEPMVFEGSVWPSFLGQVQYGKPLSFFQHDGIFKIDRVSNPRWHSDGRKTLPVTMHIENGVNVIDPPPRQDENRHRFPLAEKQHPKLQRLM